MLDYQRSVSPPASVYSEETDGGASTTLSHRNVSKFGNNFKAGYVPVESVDRSPTRGRKTFAFWTLLVLLFLLVIGNLILTVTIIGVLRLGQGMQSIELIPEEETIKLYGKIDLDNIYKRDGKLESFQEEPLVINADDNPILLNILQEGRVRSKVKIDPVEISFKDLNRFDLKSDSKETIFSVTDPVYHNLRNVKDLKTKYLIANKVRSPLDENLKVNGEVLHLKGAEGTEIEGKEILWYADHNIFLNSTNGSVVLSAKEGVYIDHKTPKARISTKNYITSQFKVCVCMPEGKLFRIPIQNPNEPVYCHHINMSPQFNPCM